MLNIARMALTFTEAGARTQLDAVATAIDGDDIAGARKAFSKAWLVYMGLPLEVRTSETGTKLRQDFEKFDALLDSLAANSATDRRRLIRTGVGYMGRRNRRCCD